LTALRVEDIQQREEHWVIADLIGKGGHISTEAECHLRFRQPSSTHQY
jgi:hypothetical protein